MATSTPASGQTSSEGANGTAGTGQASAQGAATQQAPIPTEIEAVYKGKTVKLAASPEKVREWAQKALLVDDKTSDLHRDPAQFKEFKDFQRELNASPALNEAMSRARMNPELVLNALKTQTTARAQVDDGDEGSRATVSPPAQDPALRAQIAELQSKLDGLLQQQGRSADESAIDGELQKLKSLGVGQKGAEQVRDFVLMRKALGDTTPISALVGSKVQEQLEVEQERQLAKLERDKRQQEFATTNPNRGAPMVSLSKPMSKESFKNGELLKEAANYAKKFFGS